MITTKIHMDWETMHKACSYLTNALLIEKNLKPDFTIDAIVALSRGGLIPGVCLSHLLSPALAWSLKVYCLGITSYNNEQKSKPDVYQVPDPKQIAGKSILLIDDLVDTGDSMRDAKEYLLCSGAKSVTTAVFHEKENTIFIPDFKAFTTKHNAWIVYPWEVKALCESPSTD